MKKFFLSCAVLVVALGMATAVLAADGGAPRVATLTGAAETPPHNIIATGFATIRLNYGQGTVCWEVTYTNLSNVTAAHIHVGPVGVAGQVVVPLSPIAAGCRSVARALIKAIIQNPENYYVNVHNTQFPGGAIRGQLSNPGQNR